LIAGPGKRRARCGWGVRVVVRESLNAIAKLKHAIQMQIKEGHSGPRSVGCEVQLDNVMVGEGKNVRKLVQKKKKKRTLEIDSDQVC